MEDFLPFDLTSSDVILGIQWLETLGDLQINWKLQRMRFQLQGQRFKIQGDLSLCRSMVSLKSLACAVRLGGQGILIECGRMELVEPSGMC